MNEWMKCYLPAVNFDFPVCESRSEIFLGCLNFSSFLTQFDTDKFHWIHIVFDTYFIYVSYHTIVMQFIKTNKIILLMNAACK